MGSGLTAQRKVWPNDYIDEGGEDIGVRCPKCNCAATAVSYTRHRAGGYNLRSRTCRNCGRTFPTYERTA